MKNKAKKPKDELIHSLLEDLKSATSDSSPALDLSDDLGELQGLHPEYMNIQGEDDRKAESLPNIDVLSFNSSSQQSHSSLPNNEGSKTDILSKDLSSLPSTSYERPSNPGEKDEAETLNGNAPSDNETVIHERTVVKKHRQQAAPEPRPVFGGGRGKTSPYEAQFSQAENMRMAQQRILELEKEIENLRKDNEMLSSAAEVSHQRFEEMALKVQNLERQKHDLKETNESELRIFKEGLAAKDKEIRRLQAKVDEFENRLSTNLRKIRVRERELENRLELAKAEKAALMRAKDETILELKRKIDHLEGEIESYQNRIIEMGQKLEDNQNQFARTVRALRIALTNLEVSDSTNPSITIAPAKKAE